MRFFSVIAAVALISGGGAGSAFAQDQTLADIRQELSMLYVQVQRLKRELSTTGTPGAVPQGGSTLERVDAIERELQNLTGKAEKLEYRINRVVKDGTNRIGDLEFRLVELEGGDVSKLGETTTLGGIEPGPAPAPQPETETIELAVGEKADFERASEALAQGDFRTAADLFAAFGETYPGGPMTARAHLKRGEAHAGLGNKTDAARAYLEAFSTDPNGADAPEALFRLGQGLGYLGQTSEACVTLAEVGLRFPGGAAMTQAQQEMTKLGCP